MNDARHDAGGRPLGVMFVHAHPDDETTTTGATIARYAAEGVDVSLVTCTRGEQGEHVDPDAGADLLARIGGRTGPRTADAADRFGRLRAGELSRACRSLGIGQADFLGGPGRWPDSGMAGSVPQAGSFSAVDPDDPTCALVGLVRARRPQVLVTYDANGGYGHPDHIRAHQITIAAYHAAADVAAYPGTGAPWQVERVYAAVVPHSALSAAAAHLAGTPPQGANPFADAARAEPLPFGVPDDQVDVHIDATAHLPAKIAAMRAHRSQMHPEGWFFALTNRTGSTSGNEYYRQLHPVRHGSTTAVADLFTGL